MIRRLGFVFCLAFALPALSQTTLNGAGATFPYPIYSKWFSEYHKAHSDVEVNYQSIGSGGGIRQVQAGTVDFGASDGPTSTIASPSMRTSAGRAGLPVPSTNRPLRISRPAGGCPTTVTEPPSRSRETMRRRRVCISVLATETQRAQRRHPAAPRRWPNRERGEAA